MVRAGAVLLQAWLPTASQSHAFGPKRRPGGAEARTPGEPVFAKIVALVPVRDEAHLLPSTLRALSHIVDAAVVLDDCSTDGSGEVARSLAEECKVERVARTPSCPDPGAAGGGALPSWGDEFAQRNFLLQLGRQVGGTHFLMLDADEVLVVGHGAPDETLQLRLDFRSLQPGDVLVVHYVTMYKTSRSYRSDKNDMKAIGFADQEGAVFRRNSGNDRLHASRIPYIPKPGTAFELL